MKKQQEVIFKTKREVQGAIKVKGIAQYVINSMARKWTHFKFGADGNSYYFFKDKWITEEKFFELHPIELTSIRDKGDNPDKTRV